MRRLEPVARHCVVCLKSSEDVKVIEDVVDGVKVIACEKCLGDPFRRPRALEFTLRGRP